MGNASQSTSLSAAAASNESQWTTTVQPYPEEAIVQCNLCDHHAGVPSTVTATILEKVTPHVPVAAPAVRPSQQMQQALVQLNLAAAKLLASFLPTSRGMPDQDGGEGWRDRLQDYYIGVMEHGRVLPSR